MGTSRQSVRLDRQYLALLHRLPSLTPCLTQLQRNFHLYLVARSLHRAIVASSREGDLVFDPFCGSGTTGVASKELGRFFVGAEKEGEYAELAGRRIGAAVRGGVLREIPYLSARDS